MADSSTDSYGGLLVYFQQ